MSQFFPTTTTGQVFPTSTTQLTIPLGQQCISGFVNLFQFIQPPSPGSVIGTISTNQGTFNLIQTQPTPLGGTPLSSVNGRFATLCGVFFNPGGNLVFDVRIVNPGAPSPTGTPVGLDFTTLLALILILLLFSGGQRGFGLGGGLGNLTSLLSQPGGVTSLLNQPTVRSLLPQVQRLLTQQPGLAQALASQVQSLGINLNTLASQF